jgi:hypothetical protein
MDDVGLSCDKLQGNKTGEGLIWALLAVVCVQDRLCFPFSFVVPRLSSFMTNLCVVCKCKYFVFSFI